MGERIRKKLVHMENEIMQILARKE